MRHDIDVASAIDISFASLRARVHGPKYRLLLTGTRCSLSSRSFYRRYDTSHRHPRHRLANRLPPAQALSTAFLVDPYFISPGFSPPGLGVPSEEMLRLHCHRPDCRFHSSVTVVIFLVPNMYPASIAVVSHSVSRLRLVHTSFSKFCSPAIASELPPVSSSRQSS